MDSPRPRRSPGRTTATRRDFLVAASLGIGAWGLASCAGAAPTPPPTPSGPASGLPPRRNLTVAQWRQSRKAPYFIAHRGTGSLVPEHSLPAYRRAIESGADALELSVGSSQDGVLYCLHDATLDRTTNALGRLKERSSAEIDAARLYSPGLGPAWNGENAPKIPRLGEALDIVGGRAVLAVEAKDGISLPAVAAMIRERGLSESVMVKFFATDDALKAVEIVDWPRFAYLGDSASIAEVDRVAARLQPARGDVLVLPLHRSDTTPLPPDVVRHAISRGLAVWSYPVHRRSQVAALQALGVEGFITPDLRYLSADPVVRTTDEWGEGHLASGDLLGDPYAPRYHLQWPEPGVIRFAVQGRPSFLTLGSLGALNAPRTLAMDLRLVAPPRQNGSFMVVVGCPTDRYLDHSTAGREVVALAVAPDGAMQLTRWKAGTATVLTEGRGPELPRQGWRRVTLRLAETSLSATVEGAATLTAAVPDGVNGYVHVGRAANGGAYDVRKVQVS